MRSTQDELITIRDYLIKVAEGTQSEEIDTLVYRMFGSLSKEKAQGVVIGLNVAIRELARPDNK